MNAFHTVDSLDTSRYGDTLFPLAVAHRGGADLGVENTMEAFERSWALGVRYLELDIRLTRDGVPVVFHDATLTRVQALASGLQHREAHWHALDRTGVRIADLTLAELSTVALPRGQVIPTLADVVTSYPHAKLMLDMKDFAALAPTMRLLDAHGMVEQSCLAGCWDGMLSTVREDYPDVSTALGWRSWGALLASGHTGVRARWRTQADFAHIPATWRRMTTCIPRVIERAHDLGVRVIVWGAEDTATMQRLLADGVDGIITNRPDLLRDVLISRGEWSPRFVSAVERGTSHPSTHKAVGAVTLQATAASATS